MKDWMIYGLALQCCSGRLLKIVFKLTILCSFYIEVHCLSHQLNAQSYLIQILKEHLQHVAIEVYHLHGEKNDSFKNQMLLVSCSLLGSLVCGSFVIDIKYKSTTIKIFKTDV